MECFDLIYKLITSEYTLSNSANINAVNVIVAIFKNRLSNINKAPNIIILAWKMLFQNHHKKAFIDSSLPFNNFLYKIGNFITFLISVSLSRSKVIAGKLV